MVPNEEHNGIENHKNCENISSLRSCKTCLWFCVEANGPKTTHDLTNRTEYTNSPSPGPLAQLICWNCTVLYYSKFQGQGSLLRTVQWASGVMGVFRLRIAFPFVNPFKLVCCRPLNASRVRGYTKPLVLSLFTFEQCSVNELSVFRSPDLNISGSVAPYVPSIITSIFEPIAILMNQNSRYSVVSCSFAWSLHSDYTSYGFHLFDGHRSSDAVELRGMLDLWFFLMQR